MKVEIQYFKGSGKYYCEGTYKTEKNSMGDIFQEACDMLLSGNCPGLRDDAFNRNSFAAYISVPEHDNNHPYLLVSDGYGSES